MSNSTTNEVISALHAIANSTDRKKAKAVRAKDFSLNVEGMTLTSWNMRESDYKSDPCPFPLMARGLFTTETAEGENIIVVRGYDKFFNLGETKYTQVRAMPKVKSMMIFFIVLTLILYCTL